MRSRSVMARRVAPAYGVGHRVVDQFEDRSLRPGSGRLPAGLSQKRRADGDQHRPDSHGTRVRPFRGEPRGEVKCQARQPEGEHHESSDTQSHGVFLPGAIVADAGAQKESASGSAGVPDSVWTIADMIDLLKADQSTSN